MKNNLIFLLLALLGTAPALSAQWLEANFKSSQETVLPAGAFVAGKDGTRPYYITKVIFNGNTYITKIGKGWTGVSIPNGNSMANIGVMGAQNNPFLVYCGEAQWAAAGNGRVPAGSVVVPAASGDVFVAKVDAGPTKTTIGWVVAGQSEAQYIDQGKLFRTSSYELLTGNSTPPPVAVSQESYQTVSPETRRALSNKPVVAQAPGARNSRNTGSGNQNTGGVTLAFVYENGKPVNGEEVSVEVTVYDSSTRAMVGTYNLESVQGELPLANLAPGTYNATIKASYQENTSGNREGWTTTVSLAYSPNPFNFTIRGGMTAVERVMLLVK